MLISQKVVVVINRQIGNEMGASLQYLAIANYFAEQGMPASADFFSQQAEEEHRHALKFNKYVVDSGGKVVIPDVSAPKNDFASPLEALELSLTWETQVTGQINQIYFVAGQENDYITQNFLGWFLKEQIEEVATMDTLVKVARRAGPNLQVLEDFIARTGAKLRAEGEAE